MIEYIVQSKNPNAHLFNVTMTITDPAPDQRISMPNWIPGSYLFRDYAKQIVIIEAYNILDGKKNTIPMHKIDNSTWEINQIAPAITIEYTVYAWDISVEGAYLDQYQGFFNGAALFLMVHGKENERCDITIERPNCPKSDKWQMATTLLSDQTPQWDFGQYYALSYFELIDRPVTMGKLHILEFSAANIPHYIVISGKHNGDLHRLVRDVTKICETHIHFFRDPAPFDQYIFHLAVIAGDEGGGGGLEHSFCSALMVERNYFPVHGDPSFSEEYLYLISLFSHEYFHAWNVKRIRPAGFMQNDLNSKNYTNQLWSFEGVTSYYADLTLARAGIITMEKYCDLLADNISKLLSGAGRNKQTLTESSFDVWIKYNQPNENSVNSIVNYYVKGNLVGLCFDIALRLATNDMITFDDVLRTLWNDYGKRNIGVPEGTIDRLVVKLGGESLTTLVNDALYTTKELPLQELLQKFGFDLTLTSILSKKEPPASKGKGIQAHQKYSFKRGVFGITTINSGGRIIVTQVFEDSAASVAGISANDEIVAVDGIRVNEYSFDKIADRLRVGQSVSVHVFRQDVLKKLKLILTEPPLDVAHISLSPNASESQKTSIDKWLSL
jgi:predicted metalloprotease with PDZ domain